MENVFIGILVVGWGMLKFFEGDKLRGEVEDYEEWLWSEYEELFVRWGGGRGFYKEW